MDDSFIEFFLKKYGYLVFQPIYFWNGNGCHVLYGMEVLTRFSNESIELKKFFSSLQKNQIKLLGFYRWQYRLLMEIKSDFLSTGARLFINFFPQALSYTPVFKLLENLGEEFRGELVVEIMESGLSRNCDILVHSLKELRRLKKELTNIKVFIDDFGSGETGLVFYQFICEGVIDGIKIDKMYLDMMIEGNEKAWIIVEHTVSMVKRIGLDVCMEGIENRKGYEITRRLGISLLQGFYLGKPERFQREKFLKVLKVEEGR